MAGLLAFLAVVLAAYPDQGSRDDTCMALGGTLMRAGIDPAEADDLIVMVARLAGDDETDKRHGKAQAAAAKQAEGGEVTGFPRMIELLDLENCAPKLRKWLGLGKDPAKGKTLPAGAILVQGGDINRIIDQAEAALIANGEPIYQRGGELVRAARLEVAQSDDGIKRRAGSTMLLPVRAPWLIQAMARSATWMKMGEKGPFPVDPADKYANGLLGRAGEWQFPVLVGLATAPTMDRDGRLIQTPGFDAASGLLLDFEDGAFPPIPEAPTKEDAEAALSILLRPLRGFPFADAPSEAVAVAAILTGLMRPTMATAPMHAFDAPTPGTGKSKLTSVIGIIATGREPAAMSQGRDPEEDEKRLSAALRSGDPVLLIDNCEKEITGPFLCMMLTQQVVSPRILGQTELLRLPCRVLLMATGNNLRVAADMTRRVMKCRLDAKMEQPEKRKFKSDCVQEARETRGALVAAALTILRAYIFAGRPGEVESLGSFDDYNIVRGALSWLGMADPDTSREEIVANDPAKGLLSEILVAWRDVHGDRAMKVTDIPSYADSNDDAKRRLYDLLVQAAGGRWNTSSIGGYLSRNRDRPVDGLILRATMKSKVNHWSVAEDEGGSPTEGDHRREEAAQDSAETQQDEIPF